MNNWVLALVLVVAAAATLWMWRLLDEDDETKRVVNPHEPDYIIDNMVRQTMDETGRIGNILIADKVIHYPDDDTTELARPRLEIYNGDVKPWHVIAENGWVGPGGAVVMLHGEVEIWRLDAEGNREFEVLTSELRVLPDEQYAETAEAAIINGPATTTTAIGMRANFEHDRLELLERVRTRYEVEPRGDDALAR